MASTDTGFGKVRLFDDFLVASVNLDDWNINQANNGVNFAINTQVNGVIRGTSTNNSSNDLAVLYGELVWKPNSAGPLTFEARCAIITSLSQLIFIGLSDQAAAEIPISNNTDTWATTASDAVGFVYAGGVSSEVWHVGGVKADSDTAVTDAPSSLNPVAATFQTFRIVVAADGSASFYINGVPIKENLASACTASTALMPFFSIRDDGAAGSLDIDYCYVSAGRA
jgi:hypothetical protein